jgi:hypothetical protein
MGTGDSRRAGIGCHGRLVEGGESEEKEEKQQSVVLGQQKDGQWCSGHGEPKKGKKRVPCDLSFQVDFQYHVPHVVLHCCLLLPPFLNIRRLGNIPTR